MKAIRTNVPWIGRRDYRSEFKQPKTEELVGWLMENVGEIYVDWDVMEYLGRTEIILWKDSKATLTMLRWGCHT